jgi:hypothetical protein
LVLRHISLFVASLVVARNWSLAWAWRNIWYYIIIFRYRTLHKHAYILQIMSVSATDYLEDDTLGTSITQGEVSHFTCSPVHKICLLFTELNNEDKHIFRDDELRKQSANFKQTQHKQIIYFHVNRYIIWICQRFVKQNKVVRFPVHMKTYHQSTKKCKYRTCLRY